MPLRSFFAIATILALPVPNGVAAPALKVMKGGALMATMPITFTSVLAELALVSTATASSSPNGNTIPFSERGQRGGLLITSPTNVATTAQVEGIAGSTFGGTAPTDSSGTLQCVRVWHGGAIVGANHEIIDIAFGSVGSGAKVAYCEMAYNADYGFEFFGDIADVKYLSVLFAGDDAFDTDDGYVGKGQFLFAMTGAVGNYGCEMDSKWEKSALWSLSLSNTESNQKTLLDEDGVEPFAKSLHSPVQVTATDDR
jgi:hypothetical protein